MRKKESDKPREVIGDRFCPTCKTKLSRYNLDEFCYVHIPRQIEIDHGLPRGGRSMEARGR